MPTLFCVETKKLYDQHYSKRDKLTDFFVILLVLFLVVLSVVGVLLENDTDTLNTNIENNEELNNASRTIETIQSVSKDES